MKKSILIIASILTTMSINAQVPVDYEIATWQGFKKAAITYSFDDGTPNQLPIAVPILDKYGYKGTFNLITSWVTEWNGWKTAADNGHEIASHTVSHPSLTELSDTDQTKQLAQSKELIEQMIGKECITMVYPYCNRGNDAIVADYYISARSCSGQISDASPQNLFDITSKVVGTESNMQTAVQFNEWVASAVDKSGWCVFLIHAIDNDGGYSPIKSTELDAHLRYVKDAEPTFWVGTFAEITKYIIERNSLIINEVQGMDYIEVSVSLSTSNKLTKLDVPVSVKRKLPDGCEKMVVTNNNRVVKSEIEDGYILFDVVPDETYTLTF